ADRNRSHWSTSKTPSYTKSVSWQHHPPKVTHEDLVKNRPRSPVRPPIPATAKTPDLPERH
ncbi:putative protein YneK, partial [Escherichia coli]|uniref:putative protein YneK n=1 Tax=Escherichia coli TaxID=562 RepID=UPI002486821C